MRERKVEREWRWRGSERESDRLLLHLPVCALNVCQFQRDMSSAAAPHVANDGELRISGVQRLTRATPGYRAYISTRVRISVAMLATGCTHGRVRRQTGSQGLGNQGSTPRLSVLASVPKFIFSANLRGEGLRRKTLPSFGLKVFKTSQISGQAPPPRHRSCLPSSCGSHLIAIGFADPLFPNPQPFAATPPSSCPEDISTSLAVPGWDAPSLKASPLVESPRAFL